MLSLVLFDNGSEFVVHCSNPLAELLCMRASQQVYRKMFPWSTCLMRVRVARCSSRGGCDAFLSWGFAFCLQGRTLALSCCRKRERR
jgi:hypothetical protein